MSATTNAEQNLLAESVLYNIFDRVNSTHFNNEVPLSRVKWSDRIGTGKNYHRFADFTVFQDKQFQPVIRLSKHLLAKENIQKVSEVIFHEMTHIWLWNTKKPWGHTPEFYEKIKTFNVDLLELNNG